MGTLDRLAPLICEAQSRRVSAGRVAFWIAFAICAHFWVGRGTDVPPYLFGTLGALLAYNFGKKTQLNRKDDPQ